MTSAIFIPKKFIIGDIGRKGDNGDISHGDMDFKGDMFDMGNIGESPERPCGFDSPDSPNGDSPNSFNNFDSFDIVDTQLIGLT